VTQAAPQTVFNDRLSDVVDAIYDPPGEFALRGLRRDIESLKRVDSSGYYELSAHLMLAAGKLDDADEEYSRAFRIAPGQVDVVVRYLTALSASNQSQKLRDRFNQYWETIRMDPAALRHCRGLLGGHGWIETQKRVDPELAKMKVAPACQHEGLEGFDSMLANQVSEEEVAAVVTYCREFLYARRLAPHCIHSHVVPDGFGDSRLMYTYFVETTTEHAGQVEWDLFEALAEKEFSADSKGVLVTAVVASREDKSARISN